MAEQKLITTSEVWKAIPGYDFYEASNLGQVRGIIQPHNRQNTPHGKVLSPYPNRGGYLYIKIRENGKKRVNHGIHSLVMLAFVGEPPAGKVVNHIDACRANNWLSNLEYVTPRENAHHAKKLGRLSCGERHGAILRASPLRQRGESSHQSKLTTAKVLEIRRLSAAGLSRRSLAVDFSVSESSIGQILRRESWNHV